MKKHSCFGYALALIAIVGFPGLARGQTYCNANASYQAQFISSVKVGSIYNITLLSLGGYANYTSLWTAMTKGTGYLITVTNGFGFTTDQCAIWADWNQDGDFTDAGEQITVTGTPGLGPYTAAITPPTSALNGNTRLRVRLSGQGSFNSCGTTMYGETEDYTINVGGTAPVNDIGVINITAPQTGTNLGANETVTVLINNFGTSTQTGFPVSYSINNGTPVTETIAASVAPGNSYTYSFTQKANLNGIGVTYVLKSYTTLASDTNHYNDTTTRSVFHGWAQNAKVVQGEYFVNTDPGVGNGTPISGTFNLVDVTVNLTNFNLPVGSTLYVRFKSSNGTWSYPRSYKRGPYFTNSNAALASAEYFINTDPGQGNGTATTLSSGIATITNLNLPVGSTVYVRVKDNMGRWGKPMGMKRQAYFLNMGATLSYAEYFINTDPGKGNGTPVTLNSGVANITNLNLPVGSKVYMRVKDNLGRWSLPFGMERKAYFTNTGAVLSYAEYFINSDPGRGNGTPVTISGDTIKITNLNLPVNDKVYIRVKDNLNRWSMPYGMIRYVYYTIQGADLPYAEYFINTDPGQGNATPLTITNGVMNLTNFTLPVGSVVYIRVKDSYNRWSLPKGFKQPLETTAPGATLAGGEYFINTDPGKGNGIPLTFLSGVTHIDSLVLHRGDILYVRAKDNYNRWGPPRALKYKFKDMQNAAYKIKLASNGSTTLPLPMTLYPAPDSTCTWIATKDTLAWHSNDTIWVRFQDEDGFYTNWRRGVIANAGPDDTICQGGYATLTASGGSSYLWSNGMAGATIQVNPSVTTNYWVYVTDGAGAWSVDSVMVVVNPMPGNPGQITGLTEVCAGSTVTVYTVPVIPNTTSYIWTLPQGATGNSITNSIQVTFTSTAASGNILVKGSNSCGQGASSSLPVLVNSVSAGPAGAISGPIEVCQGDSNVVYSIQAISNASSYIWTLPTGITGSSSTNQISVTFSNSFLLGTITAKGTNSCGSGTAASLQITGNPKPLAAGTITGQPSASRGQNNVPYSTTVITGATSYLWTLPAGATIASGANTNSITVNFSGTAVSGNMKVAGVNTCGEGVPSPNFYITVTRPAPVVKADTVTTIPNSVVSVPVNVVNGFTNITSVSLRLEYNPTIITYQSVQNVNPVLTGILVNNVGISPTLSKIMITWVDSIPRSIASGGKMFDLLFNYLTGSTPLTWNNTANGGGDCEFADEVGNPLNDLPDTTYFINGAVIFGGVISGNFMYNNTANTPLDSLVLILYRNSILVETKQSDLTGHYAFSGQPNGIYTIQATTQKPWNGVNGTDAIKVQRHFAGLELLTEPVRLDAGDVNMSGSINGTDAVKIKRRFAALDTSFTRGNWTFAIPTTGGNQVTVTGANVIQNFYGLCVGDVNGSNIPSVGEWFMPSVLMTQRGIIEVLPSQEFDLPIRVKNDLKVSAISLIIPYPEEYFEIVSILFNPPNPVYNIIHGEIRFVWSELDLLNLKAGDELMVLRMRATDKFIGNLAISLDPNAESEFADDTGEPIPLTELISYTIKPLNQIGINEQSLLLVQTKIYPNPASDVLNVEVEVAKTALLDVELTDMLGKPVTKLTAINLKEGINKFQVNTSGLSDGLYYLKLLFNSEIGHSQYLHKVVINR